jgi:excisionase family DNA binding protein
MESRLFKVSDVAKTFGVDRHTIVRWIRSGRLKSQKTVGGHNRISEKEIIRLQEELLGRKFK